MAAMQSILFNMHFRCRTSAAGADSKVFRTTGSATGCIASTTIHQSGMEAHLEPSSGDLAFLESELRITGEGCFEENGTITFGDNNEHALRFSTMGEGHFTSSLDPQILAGSASFVLEGGEGQFASARGLISSAFTLSASGDRSDFHSGLIFLHEP
jgi:hypothetical protein